jgi:predicted metal-dependent peptidase
MLSEADPSTYNFSYFPIAAGLLTKEPFYCACYRRFRKIVTRDMPTACVMYDKMRDSFTLAVNPDWMMKHTIEEQGFIIAHEMLHFAWMHITMRARDPAQIHNIACDLTINSTLKSAGYSTPKDGLFPGVRPDVGITKCDSEEMRKALEKVADLIESFPPGAASDMYFLELSKNWPEELKSSSGSFGEFDDHTKWGDSANGAENGGVADMDTERMRARAKSTLSQAVAEVDRQSSGWGTIPADIVSAIREFVSPVIRWRSVLKNFIGTLVRADKTTSIKRINRRYPYIHPGVKYGRLPKLLIAVDESGSVPDDMLGGFFSELSNLVKKVDIDVVPFDSHVREKALTRWRKGQKFSLDRQATGGTSFDAPTDFVNDPIRRGHYDGMLILTDGCCSAPKTSRVKRGWVLGPGCKMAFDPGMELVVAMDNYNAPNGAIR